MTTPTESSALQDFSQCHAGIVRRLNQLGELPALLEPMARARHIAQQAVEFFREAIFEHHLDEERELFPQVLAHAADGDEKGRVQAMVDSLVVQHRDLESMWKRLEPGLKKLAKGEHGDVNPSDVESLVLDYRAHAEYEEREFLPLAQEILGRNADHLAALGLSIHMRHVPPDTFSTYV